MKHTAFAALPAAERQALFDALERNGVPPGAVCVSKVESAAREGSSLATVTAPGWSRSYDASADWVALLERDLVALRGTA